MPSRRESPYPFEGVGQSVKGASSSGLHIREAPVVAQVLRKRRKVEFKAIESLVPHDEGRCEAVADRECQKEHKAEVEILDEGKEQDFKAEIIVLPVIKGGLRIGPDMA